MLKIKPKARQSDIVVQEFGQEILIYDLMANKAFALNETSSMVWQYCDGKNSVSDIARKMTLELEEFVSEELIWLALEKLKVEELIEKDKISFTIREIFKTRGNSSSWNGIVGCAAANCFISCSDSSLCPFLC